MSRGPARVLSPLGSRSSSPRLVFLAYAIQGGGAERVMTILANAWVSRGWNVTLATLDDGRCPPFYPLDPRLEHVHLGVSRGQEATGVRAPGLERWGKLFRRARMILTVRRKLCSLYPDLVISFIDKVNLLALMAMAGTGIPVIVSERVDPAKHDIGWPSRALRWLVYPFAAQLIVQSETIQGRFRGAIRRKSRVIPNPVLPRPALSAVRSDSGRRTVIAVGRLVHQKGFDLLLRAFAGLAMKHGEWDLEIWGEGEERANLEALRDMLGLAERCRLPGSHPNIHEALALADLFVLSSRYEGFPNALCEAMAIGLPSVAFDCPCGPSQIIRHGTDGLLVKAENPASLAEAMDCLMSDECMRKSLAHRAPEVLDRYSLDSILALWEQCIRDAFGWKTDPSNERG